MEGSAVCHTNIVIRPVKQESLTGHTGCIAGSAHRRAMIASDRVLSVSVAMPERDQDGHGQRRLSTGFRAIAVRHTNAVTPLVISGHAGDRIAGAGRTSDCATIEKPLVLDGA